LHAVAFDVGLQDSLLTASRQLDQALNRKNFAQQYEEYEGTPFSGIAIRTESKVLPFISSVLGYFRPCDVLTPICFTFQKELSRPIRNKRIGEKVDTLQDMC
jgi:hypothetical protein